MHATDVLCLVCGVRLRMVCCWARASNALMPEVSLLVPWIWPHWQTCQSSPSCTCGMLSSTAIYVCPSCPTCKIWHCWGLGLAAIESSPES